MDSKHILVHVCCAPCATSSIENLLEAGYEVTLFYSNSNIFPEEEYRRRLGFVHWLGDKSGIDVIEDSYNHLSWLKAIKGLENEPEKGKRCIKCFDYNLKQTAVISHKLRIPYFTTTLTLSPHKISKYIFEVGKKYPGYISFDFKKGDGIKRSHLLCKEYDIYRQNYCGCEFSLEQRHKK
ncbi:MAG: epoxyqueuosine reductase QueH [Spirochaetota bacterium]|nr:MAG: epoxyqueuosine reductase QueH [Spirochaetota bacterium]